MKEYVNCNSKTSALHRYEPREQQTMKKNATPYDIALIGAYAPDLCRQYPKTFEKADSADRR